MFHGLDDTGTETPDSRFADYEQAGEFMFAPNTHDNGAKRVLGVDLMAGGGMKDALKMIDVLAHHPSTARHLSRKLVVRFVSTARLKNLVKRANDAVLLTNGDIRSVLSVILHSDEFKNSFGLKIKRPFELVASTSVRLDMQVQRCRDTRDGSALDGQGLFLQPTPDGYPDTGSAWINTSGLLQRWNHVLLAAGNKIQVSKWTYQRDARCTSAYNAEAVDFWIDRLLHRTIRPPTAATRAVG